MKFIKTSVVLMLVLVLTFAVTACGGGSSDSTAEYSSTDWSASPSESLSADEAAVQAQTNQEATVEAALPAADTAKASDTDLLGTWTDVNAPDRYATITKTDTGYQYEDNEGKYPATLVDGVLKVQVLESDPTDTADVYIEAESGHLLSVYQDNQSEFVKK
ncbi:MAG TPA: hypothetical protein VHT96_14535 [Clostridia bacterium]|nr:hypothetical protein [Clostridia bacterium]